MSTKKPAYYAEGDTTRNTRLILCCVKNMSVALIATTVRTIRTPRRHTVNLTITIIGLAHRKIFKPSID